MPLFSHSRYRAPHVHNSLSRPLLRQKLCGPSQRARLRLTSVHTRTGQTVPLSGLPLCPVLMGELMIVCCEDESQEQVPPSRMTVSNYFTALGKHKREQLSRAMGCQLQGQASTTVWNKLSQACIASINWPTLQSTGVEQNVHCSRLMYGSLAGGRASAGPKLVWSNTPGTCMDSF